MCPLCSMLINSKNISVFWHSYKYVCKEKQKSKATVIFIHCSRESNYCVSLKTISMTENTHEKSIRVLKSINSKVYKILPFSYAFITIFWKVSNCSTIIFGHCSRKCQFSCMHLEAICMSMIPHARSRQLLQKDIFKIKKCFPFPTNLYVICKEKQKYQGQFCSIQQNTSIIICV